MVDGEINRSIILWEKIPNFPRDVGGIIGLQWKLLPTIVALIPQPPPPSVEDKKEEKSVTNVFTKCQSLVELTAHDKSNFAKMKKHAAALRSSCFYWEGSAKYYKWSFLDKIIKLYELEIPLILCVKIAIKELKSTVRDVVMSGMFSREVEKLTDEVLVPGSTTKHQVGYFSDHVPRCRF